MLAALLGKAALAKLIPSSGTELLLFTLDEVKNTFLFSSWLLFQVNAFIRYTDTHPPYDVWLYVAERKYSAQVHTQNFFYQERDSENVEKIFSKEGRGRFGNIMAGDVILGLQKLLKLLDFF